MSPTAHQPVLSTVFLLFLLGVLLCKMICVHFSVKKILWGLRKDQRWILSLYPGQICPLGSIKWPFACWIE